MGLNFLGLGFSFGAKDSGLEEKQQNILKNFESMSARMVELGMAADKASMGDIATPGQVEQIEKMAEAMGGLEEHLGTAMPEASRKGTEQFHRDSSQMESDQRKIGGGFNFIRQSMEKLDTIARQSKLQTFVQAISLSRLNDIASGLGHITSQGQQLTTGLEAEMQSLGKSTRATGANFGYTGKALSKFSGQAASMAKGLNIDANTAATALRGWNEAGSELAAMGFRSAKEVAKFSAAFGVSADVLRNSGLRMRKEFKMGDKEINTVVGSFVKMGQITGDVTGSMNEMPKMMDLLRRRAATMGKALDSKELANYAASTAGLAAGFMQMGQSSDQARASAMAISETMIQSRENFSNMFGGTSDDISEFHKAFGIATGDISKSFESMQQGPSEFISGIAQMVQKSKKAGNEINFDILRAQLEKVFGPDKAAELVGFFTKADDATLDLMKSVGKAPANLGKLGNEAHRTGRTLAESFELAKDSFIMSFRAISRKEARSFVKETGAEFKKFNKQVKALADKGGPMGAFVKKMSEMHQLGAMSLIPKTLRPMAAVMGEVTKEMTPAVTALGAMGVKIKHLFSPFTMVIAAVGGAVAWFAKLRMEGKTTDQALAIMGATIKDKFAKAMEYVGKGVQKLKEALPHVLAFVSGLWDALIFGVDPKKGGKTKAAQWGMKLGAAIRTGAIQAINTIKGYLQNWWKKMGSIWSDSSKPFGQKIKETVGSSAGVILAAFSVARFTPIFGVLKQFTGLLGPAAKALNGLIPGPFKIIAGFAALGVLMNKYPEQVTKVLNNIGKYFAMFASKFTEYAIKIGTALIKGLIVIAPQIPGIIGNAFMAAVKAAIGILDGIKVYLQERFPSWFGPIEAAFFALKGIAIAVITAISIKWALAAAQWVKQTITSTATFIANQYRAAVAAVKSAWTTMISWGKTFAGMIAAAYGWITVLLPMYVKAAASAVLNAVKSAAAWVAANAAMIAGAIKTAAVFVAQAAIAAAGWIAAAAPVIIAWAPFIALAAAIGLAVYAIIKHWDKVKGFFKGLWEVVKSIFSTAWDIIKYTLFLVPTLLIKYWDKITGFFSSLWDGIKSAAKAVWDAILFVITSPIQAIKAAWSAIKGFFGGLWDGIKSVASKVWNGIKSIVLSPIKAIKAGWNAVKGFFGGVWNGIKGAASSAWGAIKGGAGKLWSGVKGLFGGGSVSIVDSVKKHMEKIKKKSQEAHDAVARDAERVAPKVATAHEKAATRSEKAAAMHAKAIKKHTEAVRTQVNMANNLSYANLKTEQGKAWKEWKRMVDEADKLTGDKRVEATKKANEFFEEMKKQHGASFGQTGYVFNQLNKAAGDAQSKVAEVNKGLFAQRKELSALAKQGDTEAKKQLDRINLQLQHNSILDTMRRKQRASAETRIVELAKMLDAEEISYEQYKKLAAQAVDSAKKQNEFFGVAAKFSTGQLDMYKMSLDDMKKNVTAFSVWQASMFESQAQTATLAMANLSSTQRDKIKEISTAAQQAFRADVEQMVKDGKLQGAELEAAVQASKDKHFKLLKDVMDGYKQYGGEVGAASSAQFSAVLDSVDKRAQELVNTTKSKANQFAEEVQGTFKVSGEEAASMVQEIANISPKKFRENIKVIKDEMISLLVAMKDINNGVVQLGPNAAKAFPEAKKAMDAFGKEWEKRFTGSNSIEAVTEKTFKSIKDAAKKLKMEIRPIIKDMWTEILDLTVVAVRAIKADAKQVGRMLRSISAVADTMNSSREGTATEAPKKTFKAGESKDQQMLQATHWPDWYTRDFKPIALGILSGVSANAVDNGTDVNATYSKAAKRQIRTASTTARAANRAIAGPVGEY